MKILVCGGRDYKNYRMVKVVLDYNHKFRIPITCIIHGDAKKGADSLAKQWAIENNIKQIPYPANWDLYKKAAGPIRNRLMLQENPDIVGVIAFPGGRGTAHMVKIAKEANLPVLEVKEQDDD